jgi:transcriptional antiterminator RfaH
VDWHVIHVRPRCEKKLAEYCKVHDFPHYLPLRSETKVYQRRKVHVLKPVFPGYVFTAYDQERRVDLLKSNHVVRVIEVQAQSTFLDELGQVRRALEVDETLGACEAFTEGRQVRITSGSFQGIEGRVQKVKGGTRVILNVDMIGQGVALDVAMHELEPID